MYIDKFATIFPKVISIITVNYGTVNILSFNNFIGLIRKTIQYNRPNTILVHLLKTFTNQQTDTIHKEIPGKRSQVKGEESIKVRNQQNNLRRRIYKIIICNNDDV